MTQETAKPFPFDTRKSIKKAIRIKKDKINFDNDSIKISYPSSNKIKRIQVIREGIPYSTIELISKKLGRPVKSILTTLGMPQTTYNKKKSENSLLDSRTSELLILITELIDFGLEVFNNEEDKFQRWLQKPNLSLGGHSPENLLDTITGIDEVKFALNRIEFGNFA